MTYDILLDGSQHRQAAPPVNDERQTNQANVLLGRYYYRIHRRSAPAAVSLLGMLFAACQVCATHHPRMTYLMAPFQVLWQASAASLTGGTACTVGQRTAAGAGGAVCVSSVRPKQQRHRQCSGCSQLQTYCAYARTHCATSLPRPSQAAACRTVVITHRCVHRHARVSRTCTAMKQSQL